METSSRPDSSTASIKLSIVVPVYNVTKFIERCVQSAVDQMGRDDEIILVDDGSTDGSGDYCDWFQKGYGDCIQVIHQQNKGLSEARNTGIRAATGEYIIFLDSDDWLMRGALASIKQILSRRPADVLIGKFRAYYMPPKNTILDDPTDFDTLLGGDMLDTEKIRLSIFENNLMFTAWRNIVRREFIKRNALMFEPGILHEDEEWCPRLYTSAQSFAWNSRPFYAYRLREGSIVYTKDWRKTLGLMAAVQTVSDMIKQHPALADGLQRKHNELAGRALQTLTAFSDEDRAKLFEALPKYPAVSRFILLLKNRGSAVSPLGATGLTAHSPDMFEKMVTESDDGDLLAKWAMIAFYTMIKSVRDTVRAQNNSANAKQDKTVPSSQPDRIKAAEELPQRTSLRAVMERTESQVMARSVPKLVNTTEESIAEVDNDNGL